MSNEPRIVWVVMSGELGQGGIVYGIYETRGAALKRAKELYNVNWSGWEGDDECADRWEANGDWLSVRAYAVQR